ncbi:hypothetical protein Xbed_02866 [Xenorhabdus beddingii]|uniref:Uncharacterized protein n=1 Tax=Xenorhabdus beddingii TaxID=40578 RepID=A0A1Y2SJE0_9GAMM|nr:hypothetical protein [Xenorhabdus beddingii]OTA18880.1 hypothetical protein Xbed_02866 [Xenorhabdus beddingii]
MNELTKVTTDLAISRQTLEDINKSIKDISNLLKDIFKILKKHGVISYNTMSIITLCIASITAAILIALDRLFSHEMSN